MAIYPRACLIQVSDDAPSHKKVSPLLWCANCRDGCHCTVDALRENIARAECLEKHYGPCSICFGTGTYDNDICPDCHGSGLCGCGACTDLYIKKLQDEINRNKKENNGQQDK